MTACRCDAVEPEPLDTGGAISFAAPGGGIDDTFFVVNGDVLTDLDVRTLLAFHRAHGAEATIHLTPVEDPSSFGVAALDSGCTGTPVRREAAARVCSQQHDQRRHLRVRGVDDRPGADRWKVSIERVVFQPSPPSAGCTPSTDDYWIDTGRPELYRQANLDAVSGRRTNVLEPGLGRDARVDGAVDGSVLGTRVHVEAGADVRASVLLPGARVGRGAVVVNSVLGPDADVGPGAVLDDVVLGRRRRRGG